LEADYNLALKMIFGRRLMKNCEQHGVLGDYQDGFRKGRSTTRTLLLNELMNDYNKRLRIDNFVGMTDISGCFDRILPSLVALLNKKNGCPEAAVKMHSTTLQQAKYYLKTQQGISDSYYSNSSTPVYGNGQGAGDSPSQWSQESAMLFQLYKERTPGATISSRNGQTMLELHMAAFADDTNLLGNNNGDKEKSTANLLQDVKWAFANWDQLLHATGHFMELSKCACYLSIWKFQDDGYAYTMLPEEHEQSICVSDSNGNSQHITQLPTNTSQKLLGVMKNPMGDQQDEIIRLKLKSDNYARRINSNAISRSDARLAYETFYLPAIRYSLNITSINQIDMETIQSKATAAFLSAQGYNRNMPREVVFAPMLYQGIGMRHLYDLQGSDCTRLLMQDLNHENSTTQTLIRAVLDTIQMEAGIGQPILEDCRTLDYIEWGWIPQIRDYLQHIEATIRNATAQPSMFRENDAYLMDSPYLNKITRRERIYIHRCRIHLQVATLSDISTSAGHHIHQAWFGPTTDKPSRSLLSWPIQASPNRGAWLTWGKFLRSFLTPQNSLKKPLGKWLQLNDDREYVGYISNSGQLWMEQHGSWNAHQQISRTRKVLKFATTPHFTTSQRPPTATPVDIIRHEV
jgi:hypothetical protein